jgi:bifunctional NMN adenylyltransferase/nudix hydrolase
MLDYLVFIGRFAPLHNGHIHIIQKALEQAKKVIVLVGSSNVARTPRNPFTFLERWDMIANTFPDDIISRIEVCPITDYPYNDNQWVAEVQKTVRDITLGNPCAFDPPPKIGLIGYSKDHTSYYLKMFPQWTSINVEAQFSTLNSTDIRDQYFQDFYRIPDLNHTSEAVIKFMSNFTATQEFQWLVAANKFNKNYNPKLFDVFVVCVDAVVIQSGHILLIRRKAHPGKGLLALPGGHVNIKERLEPAAIRELKEETRISDDKGELPPAMLRSFITKEKLFDDPNRSLRARVITQAYLFELPNRTKLFHVRGDDDAESAQWVPLGELKSEEFHDDHHAIISHFIGL